MNIRRYLPNGWTVTFFVLAAVFAPFGEAGLMAAAFWAGIGILNELVDRTF